MSHDLMRKFPLCAATHDQGVRWLFDLATILLLLDCRPGDRVLDLGAGSGFSSEMLARFGYDVVAIDPDITALATNRSRGGHDAERVDGRVFVAAGVAETVPCAAESFDGAFCMNVLHHVPDLDAALSELARVLRPGRRAVFCEPGVDHMRAEETQRAVREHGETDRPFDVLVFLETARSCGFSEAMLSATLQSALRLLPIQEVSLYLSNQHPRPHMTPAGVIDELHRRHAYGMLIREGTRERTSRYPGTLRASIELPNMPTVLQRGRPAALRIQVTNAGDTLWLSQRRKLGGFVTFGCKLLKADGRLVSDTIGRTPLPHDVAPSARVDLSVALEIPESISPGIYTLSFDMVNELVCWFSMLPDNTPQNHRVTIG